MTKMLPRRTPNLSKQWPVSRKTRKFTKEAHDEERLFDRSFGLFRPGWDWSVRTRPPAQGRPGSVNTTPRLTLIRALAQFRTGLEPCDQCIRFWTNNWKYRTFSWLVCQTHHAPSPTDRVFFAEKWRPLLIPRPGPPDTDARLFMQLQTEARPHRQIIR